MKKQILEAVVTTFTDLTQKEEQGDSIFLESGEYLVKLADKTHRLGFFSAELTAAEKKDEEVNVELAQQVLGKPFSLLFAYGNIKNNGIAFICESGEVDIDDVEQIVETSKIKFDN